MSGLPLRGVTPGLPTNRGSYKADERSDAGISLPVSTDPFASGATWDNDPWGSGPASTITDPFESLAATPPAAAPVAPAPTPDPEPVLLPIGADSGLRAEQGRYVTSEKTPVIVTEHNHDLLTNLTQDDIDNYTQAYRDACREEQRRLLNRYTAEDITLPENPSAEDIRRVAANIDDAFSDTLFTLDSGSITGPLPILSETYGTPDRAVVAIGNAVIARAEASTGHTAEDVEKWWLNRAATRERREVALFLDRNPELGEDDARAHFAKFGFMKDSDWRDIEEARDPATRADLADLSASYTAALNEIRPVGGALALHEESSKPGAKVVAATAAIWPADWIDASNNCPVPLHVGVGINRAHYAHETRAEFKTRGQGEAIMRDFDPDATDRTAQRVYGPGDSGLQRPSRFRADGSTPAPYSRWKDGDRVGTYVTFEPLTAEEKAQRGFAESDRSFRALEWEYRDQETAEREYSNYLARVGGWSGPAAERPSIPLMQETLRRSGIKFHKHPVTDGTLVTDPDFNNGKPFYRKPKVRQNQTGSQTVSQIRLSKDRVARVPEQDERFAPAVHEVGHRMEYLVPNLNRMARSWRQRRVEECPDPEGRKLLPIYRGTSESGYRADFVAHYIGKSYDHRSRGSILGEQQPRGSADNFTEATEVFSMGSDSVFAGRNGGLVGLSRTQKPDADMRAFILGIFATAGLSASTR